MHEALCRHPAQPSTFCTARDGPPITQRTSGLRMESRERFVNLPVELDPFAAQAFATPERTLAGDADLCDTFCSRRRLDAGDELRELPFEIVEIGQ